MKQIFNDLKRLEKLMEDIDSISIEEWIEKSVDLKLIPPFEEYCNYMLEPESQYVRVYKTRDMSEVNVDEKVKAKFEKEYLNFVKKRWAVSDFFKRKHSDIWYKFKRDKKIKKIYQEHTDKDLIRILEILTDRTIYIYEEAEILEALPKPTEEEYCKRRLEVKRFHCQVEGYWGNEVPDEESMIKYKIDYKGFIKNFREIQSWYQRKEFVQKREEDKMLCTNELRANFIAKGVPENDLEHCSKSTPTRSLYGGGYFPLYGDKRVLNDSLLNFYATRPKNTKMNMSSDNVIENKVQKVLASISLDISISNPKYNEIKNAKETGRYWRFYYLWEEIDFGKFRGCNIDYILDKDINYILWLIINVPHFIIDNAMFSNDEVITNSNFKEALECNLLKYIISDFNTYRDDEVVEREYQYKFDLWKEQRADNFWKEQRIDTESRRLYEMAVRNWSRME